MKKPKRNDFKNCRNPEAAYMEQMFFYLKMKEIKKWVKLVNNKDK